ncbi:nuclear transport factor 2 family protein [Saccharothrix sp. ST-888]|uniref:nuclear transport factor 2 family protein n=1 Tax=Saccharothrix sp. ST-888 TaxID=1427391 RepID=UPI000696BCA7|nr:nuclear transport factor 2 family protein [Saccharothrix sp. ST-888]
MTKTNQQALTDSAELAMLRELLGAYVERDAVAKLIDRYLAGLDDRVHDEEWVRSLFAENVRLVFPVGTREGIEGLGAYHAEVMGRFDRTVHLGSNYGITVQGDRAVFQFNLLCLHVLSDELHAERSLAPGTTFEVAGRMSGEAVRTPAGWRFDLLRLEVVWAKGEPPVRTGPSGDAGDAGDEVRIRA